MNDRWFEKHGFYDDHTTRDSLRNAKHKRRNWKQGANKTRCTEIHPKRKRLSVKVHWNKEHIIVVCTIEDLPLQLKDVKDLSSKQKAQNQF